MENLNLTTQFQEIKQLIQSVSINAGLNIKEAIFVIERAVEKVFYNKYTVQFDDNFNLYAINKDENILLNSLHDVKRIKHKILTEVTENRKEYIIGLKSGISLKEIAELISKEAYRLGVANSYRQCKYLLFRHIKGFIIAKTEDGYIVNIGIGKVAYLNTSEEYELFKYHRFFVSRIERDFDNGVLKVFLMKPIKKPRKQTDVSVLFRVRNGKITKNKIAIRVTDSFVWVYEVRHRDTLYRKDFKHGDFNERVIALLAAKSVFEAYAFKK